MNKGRSLTALALTFALALTVAPARAAEKSSGLLLPAVNAYAGFRDVAEGDWFYGGVRTCYEAGLMNGTGEGKFTPEGTMTVAEAATIAARLRETSTGEAIPGVTPRPGEILPWYQPYVGYLTANGVTVGEPEKTATRAEFFGLLAAVTPKDLLAPVNSIDALPDVDHGDPVLDFYNAGILTGVDENGTFAGDKTLTRAECAVMTARLADPAQRKVGVVPPSVGSVGVGDGEPQPSAGPAATPTPASPSPEPSAAPSPEPSAPADDSPVAIVVNGRTVTRDALVHALNQQIYSADYNLYQQGSRLDWNTDYGVGDLKSFFLNLAVDAAIRNSLLDAQAQAHGCEIEDLPAALYPAPSRQALEAYVKDCDLLCAKHILVDDPDTANAVLAGLKDIPTLDQFNALITVFGTDPGMSSQPDGYLFTAGEMVPEFEAGTRALEIGTYSPEPVQSNYGYHIIWRLDPVSHPDLLPQYQLDMTLDQVEVWTKQAAVSLNQELIAAIDPEACYREFLARQ